ncbi:MAG: acyltransferase [Acidiferrobacterales bacterium]|nr:acyltransferase [Acidiferrobacterales bacterium]
MSRDNNFNLIRILAALAVLISHSYVIVTGEPSNEPLKEILGVSLGSISVDIFFACSGFLVTASFVNSTSIIKFARARVLRIFPAVFVMTIVTTILVGLKVSTEQSSDFFSNAQAFKYVIKNTTLFFGVEYRLPATFMENPYPGIVNGSLWSLPHEVRCYLALALIYWFSLRFLSASQIRRLFFSTSLLVLSLDSISKYLLISIPHHHFVHLFGVFLLGASLYFYRIHEQSSLAKLAFASVFLFPLLSYFNVFVYFYGFLVPLVALAMAYAPAHILRGYNRIGDYSYGIYIYAFPIQQFLIHAYPSLNVQKLSLWAVVLSLFAAGISWHFVEKPALKFK